MKTVLDYLGGAWCNPRGHNEGKREVVAEGDLTTAAEV